MKLEDVVISAQLACLLEVACPKPGNVSRFKDFEDTRLEHFLASGAAIGEAIRESYIRGRKVSKGELEISKIGIGKMIKNAIIDTKKWHLGGNTNLGIVMLLIPLSSACGMLETFSISRIRKNVDKIVKETTPLDAVHFYDAIRIAKPFLPRISKLDVFDDSSKTEILDREITFYDIMRLSSQDSVARELVSKMKVSCELGYPTIIKVYEKEKDINKAILNAFLEILSKIPDSLIAKKFGIDAAQEVLERAKEIIRSGMRTEEIKRFDEYLRRRGWNPGTTADLVTSSLMLALLYGVRP